MENDRLDFIDLAKGYAIIMMIQGHTVDSVLLDSLRTDSSFLYQFWLFFRGITAPLFLLCSGFLVSHLFLRKQGHGFFGKQAETTGGGLNKSFRIDFRIDGKLHLATSSRGGNKSNAQIRKLYKNCLQRSLLLVAVGYLLRFNLGVCFPEFSFESTGFSYFISIHILHVLGVGLALLSTLLYLLYSYRLFGRYTIVTTLSSLALVGVTLFAAEAFQARIADYWDLTAISNYFTKDGGSVFTLLPWVGYMFFGAALGTAFSVIPEKKRQTTGWMIIALGLFFVLLGTLTGHLHLIAEDHVVINHLRQYGWRYTWLGYAIVVLFVFYKYNNLLPSTGGCNLLKRLGRRTFTFYLLHELILFGAITGYGIAKIFGRTLNWFESALLAILVLFVVFGVEYSISKIRALIKNEII